MAADYDDFEAQLTALLRVVLNDRSTDATADSKAADLARAIRGALEPTVTDEMAKHLAHPDPHPQYVLEDEAPTYAPVKTVDGMKGHVRLWDRYAPIDHAHGGEYAPASHTAETNPHSVTAAQVGAEPEGAVAEHEAKPDPHSQYTTVDEAAAAAPVQSVDGKTGAVDLSDTYAGKTHNHDGTYDPAGTGASERAAHESAPDPHPQYVTSDDLEPPPVTSVDSRTGDVTLDDLYAGKTHNHDTSYQPKSDNLSSIDSQITSNTGTGRVGIKTAAPEADLHVQGNQVRLKTTSGNAGFMAERDSGGQAMWLGAGTTQCGLMIPDDGTFAIKAQARGSLTAGLFGGTNAILITGSSRLVRMLANAQVDGSLTVGGKAVSTTDHHHDGTYAPLSHNHEGTYDPAGTAAGAISAHEGAADPHSGYQLRTEKGSPNGFAGLDGAGKVPLAQLPELGGGFDPAYASYRRTTDSSGSTGTALAFDTATENVTPEGVTFSSGSLTVAEAGVYEITGVLMLSSSTEAGEATVQVTAGASSLALEAVFVDTARRAIPFAFMASLSASGSISVLCSPEGSFLLSPLAGSVINVRRIA